MFEDLVRYIAETLQNANIPLIWILLISFGITLTENIFPPSPSDSVLIMLGSLIGLGKVGLLPLLLASTAGSIVGFIIMYWLGAVFGKQIIDSRKFSFINQRTMEKPRRWFKKYGYALIVANRFLAGTRAVISFFAGISGLRLGLTIILSGISALIWNFILISLGETFGEHWEVVVKYMGRYGRLTTIIVVGIILLYAAYLLIKHIRNKRKKKAA